MVIYKQLRKSILDESYSRGMRLPSSRILAEQLGVSRNTILEAFAHLDAEGYIESRRGSGVYVKSFPNGYLDLLKSKKSGDVVPPERSPEENLLRPFHPAGPDVSLFPFQIFSRITARCYRELRSGNYYYEDSLGYRPLREALAAYLTLKRQVNCTAEQIMIVNGSQEAIFICAEIFVHAGTRVFLENPSYKLARFVFENKKGEIHFIPVDHEGMQVDKIIPSESSLTYITPSHQFPLGHTMSIERRLKLLEISRQKKLLVIEDDYDSDFRYTGEPLASLQGTGSGGKVIYIGTLSKILFPAIRIGFCVLPPEYIGKFLEKRKLINRQPAIINQAAAACFIEKGYLYRHLKQMHRVYKIRKDYLFYATQKHLSDFLVIENSDSGLHLAARFRKPYDKKILIQKAKIKKIDLVFISDYYHGTISIDGLVMGFSTYDTKIIEKTVRNLAEIFKEI